MSLEIRILCELACPLCVCQHHRMGDFPFHPFSKQERFLIHKDKIGFFNCEYFSKHGNTSRYHTSWKQMLSTNMRIVHHIHICMQVCVSYVTYLCLFNLFTECIHLTGFPWNESHKAAGQLLFFFLVFWTYLAFCKIGQRNNVYLTVFILAFLNT